MTELLTHEEYRSLAAAMDLPQNAWIDGGYRPAISGKTFETVNPATGAVLGTVAACDAADVDLAVQKAREAFEDGRWSRLHPGARKDVLVRLAKLLERNARELAVMESNWVESITWKARARASSGLLALTSNDTTAPPSPVPVWFCWRMASAC